MPLLNDTELPRQSEWVLKLANLLDTSSLSNTDSENLQGQTRHIRYVFTPVLIHLEAFPMTVRLDNTLWMALQY
jgi:hypothetical protein